METSLSKYTKSWAIIIGVDKYKHVAPLENAVRDAKEFARLLKKIGFDKIIELYDENASKESIMSLFMNDGQLPDKVGREDRLLTFFAGHGITSTNRRDNSKSGYIIPFDGNVNRLTSLIDFNDLVGKSVRRITAKHILFLLDCCFSGIAALRTIPTNNISSQKMPAQEFIDQCTRKEAVQIIASGQDDERVLDDSIFSGHSPFTGAIINGLDTWAADLQEDGVLTATELAVYLDRATANAANVYGHKQKPFSNRLPGDRGGDFVIAAHEVLVKPEDPKPEIIRQLMQRPLAVSTLASDDTESSKTLKQVLKTGKPIDWGVGPALDKGSILAIFIPKNARVFDEKERDSIPFLFAVKDKARKVKVKYCNYWVRIHRGIKLDAPLTLEDMKNEKYFKEWRLPRTRFQGAGRLVRPLHFSRVEEFWNRIIDKNPSIVETLGKTILAQ